MNLQQIKLDNVFRAKSATRKVRVSYIDVKIKQQSVTENLELLI